MMIPGGREIRRELIMGIDKSVVVLVFCDGLRQNLLGFGRRGDLGLGH
jgi:hypothetical protein